MKAKSAKTIAQVTLYREEMIESYVDAIKECGGCPRLFLKRIDKMTVAEMIDMLAQNGVRFTVEREDEYDPFS